MAAVGRKTLRCRAFSAAAGPPAAAAQTAPASPCQPDQLRQQHDSAAAAAADAVQDGGPQQQEVERPPPLGAQGLQRNAEFVDRLRGRLILAPLTRGGHLPFRRLCADFGAEVTMSEMAFARMMLKGERKELAMMRRAANEQV